MVELADVYEVLLSISEISGKNIDEVIKIAKEKREKRGGFKERVFLISTRDNCDTES